MIHMESGLGEVLGKQIMRSIIGKNWSVTVFISGLGIALGDIFSEKFA